MKRAALVAIAFFLLFPTGVQARVDTGVLVKKAVRAWKTGNYRESGVVSVMPVRGGAVFVYTTEF